MADTTKTPIGLKILALITLFGAFVGIKNMMYSNYHVIYFGILLSGVTHYIYYLIIISLGMAIAIGFFKRKIWSLWLFLVYNFIFILMGTSNILLANESTLISAGWTTDILLRSYRIIMMLCLGITIAFILWGLKYRKILTR